MAEGSADVEQLAEAEVRGRVETAISSAAMSERQAKAQPCSRPAR